MKICAGSTVRIDTDALYVPETLLHRYEGFGITTIFDWQAECLSLPGVLGMFPIIRFIFLADGSRNLIYSAPTSAGKTLVAELIVLRHVLRSSRKAFIILPFVSVSREKMTYLRVSCRASCSFNQPCAYYFRR